MFLTTHSAIGMITTTQTASPWLVFLLSFLLHYIADTIPHGDEKIFDKNVTKKKYYQKIIFALIVDIIILAIYSFIIITKTNINPALLLIAIIGSILPDVIWGVYRIKKIKILKPLVRLHDLFHNPLNIKLPLWLGITIQIIILIVVAILII